MVSLSHRGLRERREEIPNEKEITLNSQPSTLDPLLRVPGVLRGDPLSPTPGTDVSGSENVRNSVDRVAIAFARGRWRWHELRSANPIPHPSHGRGTDPACKYSRSSRYCARCNWIGPSAEAVEFSAELPIGRSGEEMIG
jgi:hypothetical protein